MVRQQTVTRLDVASGVVVLVGLMHALWIWNCLKVPALKFLECSGRVPYVIVQGCISTAGAYKAAIAAKVCLLKCCVL